MTTHEMQPEMVDPAVRDDRPAEAPINEPPLETVDTTADFEAPDGDAQAHPPRPIEAPAEPISLRPNRSAPSRSLSRHGSDTGRTARRCGARRPATTDQMLFADGDLTDFHSRWTEVQSAFVDDPRDCVQKADGLVSDVVDQLTAGFTQARSRLEEQWSRGEQVSTEDLRLALKRYRDFFERLLAV